MRNIPNYNRVVRYSVDWQELFASYYQPFLQSDIVLLDIGAGRSPVIPPDQRPVGCTYIGIDISADELNSASPEAYDEMIVGDIAQNQPALAGRVDLALARQVLEHIDDVGSALQTIHASLKKNGHFVARFSGRNAHFAIINRLVPESLGKYAMHRLLRRQPDSVFRAHYDHCTYSGLTELMSGWDSVTIIPLYRGAGYLSFAPPLSDLYLCYENWAAGANKPDLATHYILAARK